MERSDRDIPPESDSFQRGWAIICGVLGEPFSAEGPQGPREQVVLAFSSALRHENQGLRLGCTLVC
jgi:hypothetical protein